MLQTNDDNSNILYITAHILQFTPRRYQPGDREGGGDSFLPVAAAGTCHRLWRVRVSL